MEKLPINGKFSNDEIEHKLHDTTQADRSRLKNTPPKHMIMPHPGFEPVLLPNKELAKLAYGKIYSPTTDDLEIELLHISRYEKDLLSTNNDKRKQAKKHLKFHYKKAVSIIAPFIAAGWNRWSDNILELFVNERTHKVIWGSGNCGKSIIMAVLLYIKWRVNPSQRMIVIASRVVKDSSTRVFGYIKKIHAEAPKSSHHNFVIVDSQTDKGIYTTMIDVSSGKEIKNEQGCIVSLPVKVNAKRDEIGANLLGKHPADRLTLAFDEAQELEGVLLESRIFLNWYTNERLDVYAWGNPSPVDYHATETHDMLFKLGARQLSYRSLKEKERMSHKTLVWKWKDTVVLHLAMTDSPKDDPDEQRYRVPKADGTTDHRLSFLAGKDNVEMIAQKISPNTPSWFSQVLGFPFINSDHSRTQGTVTPAIVKESKRYPLHWQTARTDYYMGVDPAGTGRSDYASIVVGRVGMMKDGRMGIDLMNGEACTTVKIEHDVDFTDATIEAVWELSQQYRVPLQNIAVETHGTGEVFRYALNRHIEDGKWGDEAKTGGSALIINPTQSPTERRLFKMLGDMKPAKDLVANYPTELYLAVRCLFLSRQVFNVPEFILTQFYNRQLLKVGSNAKYKVESKEDMLKRGIKSPNDADALSFMVEVIRKRYGFTYRFFDKGSYSPFFTDEYLSQRERKKIDKRLGLVSNILQIQTSFNTNKNAKIKNDNEVEVL